MKVFGEAGVVKLKTKISPKMDNKGKTCIFVGYPLNHAESTYLMYEPETKGVHISRDVVFLHRMYWKKKTDATKEVITVDLYSIYMKKISITIKKLAIIPSKQGRAIMIISQKSRKLSNMKNQEEVVVKRNHQQDLSKMKNLVTQCYQGQK